MRSAANILAALSLGLAACALEEELQPGGCLRPDDIEGPRFHANEAISDDMNMLQVVVQVPHAAALQPKGRPAAAGPAAAAEAVQGKEEGAGRQPAMGAAARQQQQNHAPAAVGAEGLARVHQVAAAAISAAPGAGNSTAAGSPASARPTPSAHRVVGTGTSRLSKALAFSKKAAPKAKLAKQVLPSAMRAGRVAHIYSHGKALRVTAPEFEVDLELGGGPAAAERTALPSTLHSSEVVSHHFIGLDAAVEVRDPTSLPMLSRTARMFVAGMIVGIIAILLVGLAVRGREQLQRLVARQGTPPAAEQSSAPPHDPTDAVVLLQAAGLSTALPSPMPRLRHIGASYVVPVSRIGRSSASVLRFEVPTLPAAWPLRAILRREANSERWAKIELTVDDAAAAELPPLLSCTRSSGHGDPNTGAGRLVIGNSAGAIIGSIVAQDGRCVFQRHKQTSWDIEAHFDDVGRWVGVFLHGEKIGQATGLEHSSAKPDDAQYLQVDTQSDAQSPESAMLLMCVLAVITFRPEDDSTGLKD